MEFHIGFKICRINVVRIVKTAELQEVWVVDYFEKKKPKQNTVDILNFICVHWCKMYYVPFKISLTELNKKLRQI